MLNGTWTRILAAFARLLPHLLAFFRMIKKKTPGVPDPSEPSDSDRKPRSKD